MVSTNLQWITIFRFRQSFEVYLKIEVLSLYLLSNSTYIEIECFALYELYVWQMNMLLLLI